MNESTLSTPKPKPTSRRSQTRYSPWVFSTKITEETIFNEFHRVDVDSNSYVDEPIDYFRQFIDKNLLNIITEQSNVYVGQANINNTLNLND